MSTGLLERPAARMSEFSKEAYLRCAKTYMQLREWKKALQEYTVLVESFPSDAHILEPAAICYQHVGESEKALDLFERALRIFESSGLIAKANQVKKQIRDFQGLLAA